MAQELEAEIECMQALQTAVEQARRDGDWSTLHDVLQRARPQLSGPSPGASALAEAEALVEGLKEAQAQVFSRLVIWVKTILWLSAG